MNILGGAQQRIGLSPSAKIAFLLIVSLLLWSMGAPALLQNVHAANLTSVSDTLSTSAPNALARNTIQFTSTSAILHSQTIALVFDPDTSAFTETYSSASSSDFSLNAGTNYPIVTSCTSGNQATVTANNYNTGGNEGVTFSLCAGATDIATGTPVTLVVGSTTQLFANPATPGQSYRVTIGGTQVNAGETRIEVVNQVTLTASVATQFTFTVLPVAAGVSINGETTTTGTTSTATSLPFGSLASGTPEVVGQMLQVSTNAENGFSVTVQENQPPTSATGATIDLFRNGATTSVPTIWIAPSAIVGQPNTYGHFGLTTDDTSVTDGGIGFTPTTTTPYVGNFDQPLVVFANPGATSINGGRGIGTTTVGYKIQVSDLQEAGNDYTNTLTYVATPTF